MMDSTNISPFDGQSTEFVPQLTSESGLTLTAANWQELGIKTLSYSLAALLMKPGFSHLSEIPSLSAYFGWAGKVMLFVPPIDESGAISLKSTYDGSRIRHEFVDVLSLIVHLQPHIVVFSKGAGAHATFLLEALKRQSFFSFLPLSEFPNDADTQAFGWVFDEDYPMPSNEVLARLTTKAYLITRKDYSTMPLWIAKKQAFIASDKPAQDAMNGVVYNARGMFDLKDSSFEMQFEPIDANCLCPTCKQGFTRAYLHHLISQTPLLCQRFLIQHNIKHCVERCSSVLPMI